MLDILQDIEQFLVDTDVCSPDAIFRDEMPDSPDSCVTVYTYTGFTPTPQVLAITTPVQFVSRSKQPTEAKLKAQEVYRAFETDSGIISLPSRRGMVMLLQPPFKLKTDDAHRVYYCFNATFTSKSF